MSRVGEYIGAWVMVQGVCVGAVLSWHHNSRCSVRMSGDVEGDGQE